MMKKTWFLISIIFFSLSSQVRSEAIPYGPWRFELEMKYAKIPFIIEFSQKDKKLLGTLKNGEESITLDNIEHQGKSVSIPLGPYEVSLELKQESATRLSGHLIKHNRNPKVLLPVTGVAGSPHRFITDKKPTALSLTGKWAVTLEHSPNGQDPGVIVFQQKGNNLSGSILTPTGDYRYLEGYISGNEFEAASFDGVYNYLLKGSVKDGKLQASLLSNSITKIEGKFDKNAQLPDAYKQTQLNSLSFTFPNLNGEGISLSDPKFKNKPVIIQFFGSWCPNCIDEMNYLIPWYQSNKDRGIEIIALAFELSQNEALAKKQLMKVQKKYTIPYPLLLAGSTSSDKPMEKIPGLKNFKSFPTTVYLNKKHQVVKVHAGFTGPSTGEFYENWKKEFNQTVNELLK